MGSKRTSEIAAGDRFPSPREYEGVVVAVCDYGRCDLDDRPQSVHVRDADGGEFFIALPDDVVHVCDDATCFADNAVVTVERPYGMGPREAPHPSANAHAG